MRKIFGWFLAAGFTVGAGYFWEKGNMEVAVGVVGIVVTIIITLLQAGGSEKKRDSWLKSFFYGRDFKKQYLLGLQYQNRDFDIKGLSTQTKYTLELEQVFVDLKFQPQTAHAATSDPLQKVPLRFRKDSYPIWRFFSLLGDEKIQNPKMVIVGPPGSGKTTLLKHMTLLLASTVQRDEESKRKIRKIPTIIFLRDFVNDIVGNPSMLLPEIMDTNAKKLDLKAPINWFSDKLKKGECLILLDGLDEVAESLVRRKMVAWIEHQIHVYPNSAFIVTSRPHGYRDNPISGVTVLEVMPFNRIQIDNFVQRWYLANEVKSHANDDPGVRMAAKSGADDLLRRLEKNSTLMELAVNPLLLTMIATVHRYRSALPGRRVELYKEICEVFLGRRQESKGLSLDMVPAQKQAVLQTLAYEMMSGNIREARKSDALEIIRSPLAMVAPNLDPEDFLNGIEQQTGLLLERELGIYSFAHKTFQEYLASMYILERNLEDRLYDKINDDWWHEVIKLYAALTDATKLITVCLDQDPPSSVALSLAVQCLEEAKQVKPELRDIAERILLENAEDQDPDIRTIVGEALLSSRLKHLSALSPTVFIDTKLITNAEYQIFIDDMLARGVGDYHPIHWDVKTFPPGSAHHPATGLIPDDALAFCEWLTTLHAGSGEWYFRLPNVDEIVSNKYSGLSGFWMSRLIPSKETKKIALIETWREQGVSWKPTPLQLIQKTTQEDIRTVIASLRGDGKSISSLDNDSYKVLSKSLQKLVKATSNADQLLTETANLLYTAIINIPSDRPVDYGYGITTLEIYDQALSDNIDRLANQDFENEIINAIQCFSALIRMNVRSVPRIAPLYLSFAFQFSINWIEKNRSLFIKMHTGNIEKKIGYLLDRYIDNLIVLGRKNKLTLPFEGLLIVKEVRAQE